MDRNRFQLLIPLACLALGYGGAWSAFSSKNPSDVPPPGDQPGSHKLTRIASSSSPAEDPPVAEPSSAPSYTLTPPFADSFTELLDNFKPAPPGEWSELSLATYSWLEQDRDGFLEGVTFPGSASVVAIDSVIKGIGEYARTLDDDELQEFVTISNRVPQARSAILRILTERLWQKGYGEVIAAIESSDTYLKSSLLYEASHTCPPDQLEDWGAYLMKSGNYYGTHLIVRQLGDEAKAWLDEMMIRHPDSRDYFMASGIYQSVKYRGSSEVPIDELLDELVATNTSDLPPDEKRKAELQNLTRARIAEARSLLTTGHPSLLDRFSNGEVSADQLTEALGPGFPSLLESSPEQARNGIFSLLAAANPQAAVAWLGDISEDQKKSAVQAAAYTMVGSSSDPKRLISLFQAYPYDPSQGPLQERFRIMSGLTQKAWDTYGDSYATWLVGLTTSVERDLALSSLAHDLRNSHPDLAKELTDAKNFVPPNSR
jgi:hypothetical protein